MDFQFNSDLLIGGLLILWGSSIIIKLIWGIDIPIFKPLVAIFLIYLGLSLLLGPKKTTYYHSTTYSYKNIDDKE
jgi:hypothetical protein